MTRLHWRRVAGYSCGNEANYALRTFLCVSERITEALLEMHYHCAPIDLFAGYFGARFLRLLKPSTIREAWVGFDQGWVRTELEGSELLSQLRGALSSESSATVGFCSRLAREIGWFRSARIL